MKKWIMLVAPALMLVACGDSSSSGDPCVPDNGKDIQILAPKGGEEYAPGDTVYISWRANVADFTGFVPSISLDNGSTWKPISNGSVESDAAGGASQCFDVSVVVPSDGSWTPDGKNESDVVFRVKDYSSTENSMKDVSKSVTILSE